MRELDQHSKNIVYASLLGFIGTSLLVLCQTYSSMIFITHFSSDKIPYLYIGSGLLTAGLLQLLKNFMNRSLNRFALTTHIAFIVIFTSFLGLLSIPASWIPFVFSILLLILVGFTSTTYILVQMRAFTLREFKSIGKYLSASSTAGAVVWGSLIPLLLKIGPSIVLLYAVLLLLLSAIIVTRLSTTESAIKISQTESQVKTIKLFKNPLFLYLFISGILAQVIQITADFAPKSLLSSYTQEEIGNILGPFYSIVNIFAIFTQLVFAEPIIKRFGVFGILLTLPITALPAGIALIFFPNLWVCLIFSGIALTSRFGFFASGQQMVMNVLPDSVINTARYQLGSLGRNLGIGFAGLVVLGLNTLGGLRLAALGAIIACVLLIRNFLISRKKYKQALIESINLHRFNLDYVNNVESDRYIINKNAESALKSNLVDVQLFGLELLSHIHHKTVPGVLYSMLSSESESVKISALKVIDSIQDPQSWQILREYLDHENNPEMIFRLIKIILKSNYTSLLPFATQNIESEAPQIQAGAIIIFFSGGNVDQVILALSKLKLLANSLSSESRIAACDVLGVTAIGDFSTLLIQLLKDKKEQVVAKAIKSARQYNNKNVVNAILDTLQYKNLYHKISKTLLSFGPEILNQLMVKIKDEKESHLIVTMIHILSIIPQESAESELIGLLKVPEIIIQNPVARSIAYRSVNLPFSTSDKILIKKHLFDIISLIQTLMLFITEEPDEQIKKELSSRILLARRRYLHLIVALCQNKVILQLIPTLMYSEPRSSVYSKALELLDLNITNRSLVSTIEYALENRKMSGITTTKGIESLSDSWLNELIAYKSGQLRRERMDIISKILVLREVALFRKLSAEALESIAETITVIDIPADHNIFKEGDMANGLYIVAKGSVKVTKNGTLLKEYREKDFFGELALMDNEPRSGNATSSSECVLYLLEKSDFNRITDDIPEILKVIVQTIMTYLRPYLTHTHGSVDAPSGHCHT